MLAEQQRLRLEFKDFDDGIIAPPYEGETVSLFPFERDTSLALRSVDERVRTSLSEMGEDNSHLLIHQREMYFEWSIEDFHLIRYEETLNL